MRRLFEDPLASRSLDDFWSRRWNRPFVEMNRLLFLRPLRRRLGARGALLGAFVLSGLLHEFALSYPAGAGYGGPLAYFTLQGVLVAWGPSSRALFWTALLAPLPLLFHAPFRDTLIVPLFLHLSLPTPRTVLTVAGLAHFLVLVASFQVPARLGGREELPRLPEPEAPVDLRGVHRVRDRRFRRADAAAARGDVAG